MFGRWIIQKCYLQQAHARTHNLDDQILFDKTTEILNMLKLIKEIWINDLCKDCERI